MRPRARPLWPSPTTPIEEGVLTCGTVRASRPREDKVDEARDAKATEIRQTASPGRVAKRRTKRTAVAPQPAAARPPSVERQEGLGERRRREVAADAGAEEDELGAPDRELGSVEELRGGWTGQGRERDDDEPDAEQSPCRLDDGPPEAAAPERSLDVGQVGKERRGDALEAGRRAPARASSRRRRRPPSHLGAEPLDHDEERSTVHEQLVPDGDQAGRRARRRAAELEVEALAFP